MLASWRVVSYWNSTSNHNNQLGKSISAALYLIEILHQTTTMVTVILLLPSCILLKFYIKPQPSLPRPGVLRVVSYWNSTSNHNRTGVASSNRVLYLIEILHQTTTVRFDGSTKNGCILLKFYIKPQLNFLQKSDRKSCILLKFYIKPQLQARFFYNYVVVSYWNSTSNHNIGQLAIEPSTVVSYWNSTSNHNSSEFYPKAIIVVSYWNSTSNHNIDDGRFVSLPVVSYWNSTSNHNKQIKELFHQAVVSYWNSTSNHNRKANEPTIIYVVSYWNSTSNHNRKAAQIRSHIVVSYWNSTSNHNSRVNGSWFPVLYLIEILHQTTTYFFLLYLHC